MIHTTKPELYSDILVTNMLMIGNHYLRMQNHLVQLSHAIFHLAPNQSVEIDIEVIICKLCKTESAKNDIGGIVSV